MSASTKVKSFDEYFKERPNYSGEVEKILLADAKKIFEALKTPEAIEKFFKDYTPEHDKIFNSLDKRNTGLSFYCVCLLAAEYASYAVAEQKKNSGLSGQFANASAKKNASQNLTNLAVKKKQDSHV